MIFLFGQQKILLNYSVVMLTIVCQTHKKVKYSLLYENIVHLLLFESE